MIKNSFLWFICLPIITITCCNFLFDLHPTAFLELLQQQHAIESKIESLSEQIKILMNDSDQAETKSKIDQLYTYLQQEQQNLLHFKNDWGDSAQEAIGLYAKRGFSAAAPATFPFVLLMSLSMIFLLAAITRYRNVPFYIRAGCISTGTALVFIIINQWVHVTLYAPALHSKITGIIFTPVLIGLLVTCLIYFTKNILKKEWDI